MRYLVELDAGPLPEGTDIADVADRLVDPLLSRVPDTAVGGRLDLRTISLTAEVEASDIEEALHHVIAALHEATQAADLGTALPVIHAVAGPPEGASFVAA